MLDCHFGSGCCVGMTFKLQPDKIQPGLIGSDIGCGISTYLLSFLPLLNTNETKETKLKNKIRIRIRIKNKFKS